MTNTRSKAFSSEVAIGSHQEINRNKKGSRPNCLGPMHFPVANRAEKPASRAVHLPYRFMAIK